jgi:hypothetical protein
MPFCDDSVIGNVVQYEEAEIDKPVFFSFLFFSFLFFSFLFILTCTLLMVAG